VKVSSWHALRGTRVAAGRQQEPSTRSVSREEAKRYAAMLLRRHNDLGETRPVGFTLRNAPPGGA
jgi:hypothetical protein